MGTPTRFTNGIGTATVTSTNGDYGMPDPTKWITYFNDFNEYVAGDWTITTTEDGSGAATEAVTDVQGGGLLVTNDDADNDADFFNLKGESFKFVAGKKTFFKARFKVSDATQSDFVMGLQITDATPLAVSDGVFWLKDDGDTNLDFHVEKDSSDTTASAVATVSDDTFLIVGFYYDGKSAIKYYVDDVHKGTSVTTNLPDDEELTVSFGIQNGAAAAKTMTVDYIFVSQER
jgi:hypothetical protein|tara:strand:- start:3078 stop:3773 length:696 start_codon:yes stop_codon:yes gene_type:complete